MKGKRIIRNIPTKDLLLLLAQANTMNCPYVDIILDQDRGKLTIQPITVEEGRQRFVEGKEGTNIEDLINDNE